MTAGRQPSQNGFTLIEVLVATAIIALALGAFISGGARYADYARYINDRTVAQWVARNQLVEYQIAPQWPGTGTEQGEAEMGEANWYWEAEITESPDPDVRRIDLRVYAIDPETGETDDDSTTLLTGFVTQRIQSVDAPPDGNGNGNGNIGDAAANAAADYGRGF